MLKIIRERLFILFALLVVPVWTAGAQTDSLFMSIDSLTFVSAKTTSVIGRSRSDYLKVDMAKMQGLPKILGNTDPLHFVKFLPGVQTTTEFNSSIHIRGCDGAHNDMSIGGVPVYGVNHLLGLFSIFNPSHYRKMTFSTSSTSNRLGGTVEMDLPDTLKKKVTGDISVGMISSQATVGVRLGKKSHLIASLRQSYLNLIYSRWLKIGESAFKYNFGDYNLTWLYADSDRDRVWVDVYLGCDRARLMDEGEYGMDFSFDWGNYKAAAHWEHKGDEISHDHILYSSGYGAECNLLQAKASLRMPSYIMANGYKGGLYWKDLSSKAELTYYRALPQTPVSEGIVNLDGNVPQTQAALEANISVGYDKVFAGHWGLDAGFMGTCFHNDEIGTLWGLLPRLSFSYDGYHLGKVTASYGWSQQNLFYTGLSTSGLPIEFWFLAGKYSRPQYAQWLDLSYDLQFFRNMFSLSCSLYAKQLFNQVEYHGDLMDMFTKQYDLDALLLKGVGLNAGLNVMLHKQTGDLTGWVSYSFGRALRRFDNPDHPGWYPANHERIHELNAACSYRYDRWDFGGTFIYATGLPFTAPKAYYLSSGQIVADYGEHNACRMRPYIRLDLSATFRIKKNDKYENGVNLSVVNAFARKNDIMYKLKINKKNQFSYSYQSFVLSIIPSLSYYHKF
jgi:hypothetical protein